MSVFEMVKAYVSVPEAAVFYGLKTDAKHMVRCPFHDDRTPSMKLNCQFYYCFGCLEHGDVIDLTAKLFGLSMKDAAEKLILDFGIPVESNHGSYADVIRIRKVQESEREREQRVMRTLGEIVQTLARWKKDHAPQAAGAEFDPKYVEACHSLDYATFLLELLLEADKEESDALASELDESGYLQRARQRLEKVRKEGNRDDKYECIAG